MSNGLKGLYETNNDFKRYVDRFANANKLTVDQTLTLAMVSDYAKYLEERNDDGGFDFSEDIKDFT